MLPELFGLIDSKRRDSLKNVKKYVQTNDSDFNLSHEVLINKWILKFHRIHLGCRGLNYLLE